MKTKLITLSIFLNLALAALLLFPRKDQAAQTGERIQVLTKTEIVSVDLETGTNEISRFTKETFQWDAIRSTNFLAYAAELKRIGCPRQTIFDILTGEINDQFLEQRRALLGPYISQFWELNPVGEHLPDHVKKSLAALTKHRSDLLREIRTKYGKDEDLIDSSIDKNPSFSMLPPEKLQRMKTLEEDYLAAFSAIQGRDINPEERDKELEALQAKFESDKMALLTPEEMKEYKLRMQSFRFEHLSGFEPSEEELRGMANIYVQNEKVQPGEALETAIKTQMKAYLGEERYAEYVRASDSDYAELWNVTEAYNLPQDVANKLYETRESLLEKVGAVHHDKSLSEEEKRARIAELQDTFDDAAEELLGSEAFSAYHDRKESRFN